MNTYADDLAALIESLDLLEFCRRKRPLERMRIMILGMTTSTFTLIHTLLCLVGIGSGLIVLPGLIADCTKNGLT